MPHIKAPSIVSSTIGLGITNESNAQSQQPHPQKIGPWKLGETLGHGATGRVLLAENVTTGEKAAVKVVSKSHLSQDPPTADKGCDSAGLPYGIEREIIIMKLLHHRHVLRLYDVWETSKALYLILEYVQGGELFDLLVEKGRLSESLAVRFFRQVTLGATYCHALGICHRDLKPENLLLDADLNVKIADFGMAALESNERMLETSCGSPHYAAPEIVSGLKYHGSASDVWSCGVILFALLTGRLPFDDDNIRNLLLKVQAGSFSMPHDISVEAQDLISKMLTVDPLERIKTRDILSHPLLTKYPCDQETERELPAPDIGLKPVSCYDDIDEQILQNLTILWHGRPKSQIADALVTPGPNPEKTFYALLMRYRHDHQSDAPVTPKNKRVSHRASLMSVGSAHRRGVSFRSDTPKNKRASPSHVSSMAPSSKSPESKMERNSSRLSLVSMKSKRKSLQLFGSPKRPSPQKRRSQMKRNSLTSKLVASYAKLSSDSDWDTIDKAAKRASSDFATLCDMIFAGEELPPAPSKKASQPKIRESIIVASEEQKVMKPEKRKKTALKKEIDNIRRRSTVKATARPKSRLDPRYLVSPIYSVGEGEAGDFGLPEFRNSQSLTLSEAFKAELRKSRLSVLDLATLKEEEPSKSMRDSMFECPAPATNPTARPAAPEVKAPALQAKEPVSMLLENPLPEGTSREPENKQVHHKESKDTLVSQSSNDGFYKTLKLPDIPQSPLKQSPSFEIHDDEKTKKLPKTSESPQKNRSASEPARKPLSNVDNVRKPPKSIFRKLSLGSKKALDGETTVERQKSIFDWFSRSSDGDFKQIHTVLAKAEMFGALHSLLLGWEQYGIKDLQVNKPAARVSANVAKSNAMKLKSCKFEITVKDMGKGSEVCVRKIKGSKNTYLQLVAELEKVLSKESVLV